MKKNTSKDIDRNPRGDSYLRDMSEDSHEPDSFFKNSALYREFLAEREEILKHKWIESEKQGKDIGFEKALLDWIVKHRAAWRNNRQKKPQDKKPNLPSK